MQIYTYNNVIKQFCYNNNLVLLTDISDVVAISRNSMVSRAPITLHESACYDYWMEKLQQTFPDIHIMWGCRTDDWISIETWEKYTNFPS